MAGYHGYSMSNNAVNAYEDGEKPISKWTKTDIINEILSINPKLDEKLLKKVNVSILKNNALTYAGWHHTSNHYNETNFYKIDDDVENWTDDFVKTLTAAQVEKKEEPKEEKALCEYLVWSGTRNHPKATTFQSEGTIKGNWFYLPNGTKKSINANGFKILKKL